MTKSEINRLGDKLRSSKEINEVELQRLQEFRSEYHAPMLKAQALVKERLRIDATARLKTVNTIVEKLRRERTRLSTMQDVAGLRIVDGRWRLEQDQIVASLVDLFDGAKIDDRRKRPTFGYRAVHIIISIDDRPVEIQVRTQLQNLWAQIVERFADQFGREIRYGIYATEAHRKRMVILERAATSVDEIESSQDEVRKVVGECERHLARPGITSEQRQTLLELLAKAQKARSELPAMSAALRRLLDDMLANVEALGRE